MGESASSCRPRPADREKDAFSALASVSASLRGRLTALQRPHLSLGSPGPGSLREPFAGKPRPIAVGVATPPQIPGKCQLQPKEAWELTLPYPYHYA